MHSRNVQCVTAFLITSLLLGCFYRFAISKPQQGEREEILTQQAYRDLKEYVGEMRLDHRKVRTVFSRDDPPSLDYVGATILCAMTIVPYSISLRLIRRFVGGNGDSEAVSADRAPRSFREPRSGGSPPTPATGQSRGRLPPDPGQPPNKTRPAGATRGETIQIHKREKARYAPAYMIAALLYLGFLGMVKSWDSEKSNVTFLLFGLLWHGLLLYLLFGFIRKENAFSRTTVSVAEESLWVDRSYVKVGPGREVIPIGDISEILVEETAGFLAVSFPDDPKYIDFADISQAERIVKLVLSVNSNVKVKGIDAPSDQAT